MDKTTFFKYLYHITLYTKINHTLQRSNRKRTFNNQKNKPLYHFEKRFRFPDSEYNINLYIPYVLFSKRSMRLTVHVVMYSLHKYIKFMFDVRRTKI